MSRKINTTASIPNPKIIAIALLSIGLISGVPVISFAGTQNNLEKKDANTKDNHKHKIVKLKEITKKYEKMKVGEKNIASAMSVITDKQIKRASSAQSIYSLLKQTPSVNEYQQNIGPGVPVLTVRGVRMSQLAQTLDGVPMISLLSGGEGAYLDYNVGSVVTSGQISGIHVYPGVAPPDRGGFATVGGTVAYTTKSPAMKPDVKIFTKVGSFNTNTYGVSANTGKIPGADGLRLYTRLTKTTSDGYIDYTPSKYTDFMFSAVKPYDYGLSKITATVLYNTSNGYLLASPIPVDLLNKYGRFYNYTPADSSIQQKNKYLTVILGDRTYVNSHLVVGAHFFYIKKRYQFNSQVNPALLSSTNPYGSPNFDVPYPAYGYVPPLPVQYAGQPFYYSYDPLMFGGNGEAGESAEKLFGGNRTLGVTPKISIFLPHNDIVIGGLIANESTSPNYGDFWYGNLNMPEVYGYNNYSPPGLKESRTVYTGYISDKINILDNRLHIEPGVTLTGVQTSVTAPASAFYYQYYGEVSPSYSLSAYNKEVLPYLGISYDITKKVIAYASYGKGARFAPVADLEPNVSANGAVTTLAPSAETVNAYEAGLRYVGKHLYVNFNGFLQNMHGMFEFYTNYATGVSQYGNIGEEQMKGLELSGKYQITPHLTVSGGVSYVDAQYMNSFFANVTPFEGQYGYAFAGDPLVAVPNWLGNIHLGYHTHDFDVGLTESYTGPQVTSRDINPNNDPSSPLADAATPNPSLKLDPYFLTNVNASYKIPIHEYDLSSLTLSLNIDNLLNNQYYSHYYTSYAEYLDGSGYGSTPFASAYPGMPRFFELGLSAKFF